MLRVRNLLIIFSLIKDIGAFLTLKKQLEIYGFGYHKCFALRTGSRLSILIPDAASVRMRTALISVGQSECHQHCISYCAIYFDIKNAVKC